MSQPHLVRSYSFGDVVKFSGATQSNVTHWVREGLIQPIAETAGSGNHRKFSFLSIVEAAVATEFNRFGMSVKEMYLPIRKIGALQRNSHDVGDSLSAWQAGLKARVSNAAISSQADARMLAAATPEEIVNQLFNWKMIASRQTRHVLLSAAGVYISLAATPVRFGLFAELKDRPSGMLFRGVGRSALFVDIIPILDELELATGDSL